MNCKRIVPSRVQVTRMVSFYFNKNFTSKTLHTSTYRLSGSMKGMILRGVTLPVNLGFVNS